MLKDLQESILSLKKERNAVILAHSYQSPEIQEIADFTGDSFALSVKAKDIDADTVLLCGVRFMADTVKILNPHKTVLLPNPTASCPMAHQIDPLRVKQYKQEHPDCCVVAYVNTSTQLKAQCDVCVTSSSAPKIVSRIPNDHVLFIPDCNLGSWVQKLLPHKRLTLWEGHCPVHNQVTAEDCMRIKALYPDVKLAVHPECPPEVTEQADLVGSTAEILQYASSREDDIIVGTEKTIADWLSLQFPKRRFPLLSKKLICHDMRVTTLSDVYRTLEGLGGEEIVLEESLRLAAKRPIDAMIELNT